MLSTNIATVSTAPSLYHPETLSHITQIHPDGRVNLSLRVCVPSCSPLITVTQVQVRKDGWHWQKLHPPTAEICCWHLELESIRPGVALSYRYQDTQGHWHPIAPFTLLERVYSTIYVPQLSYQWQHQPPQYNHARVILETTLEGLVAGYEGGVFAPRSREELFRNSISQQILRTDIPNRLMELGIDEVMASTCSAMSDRSFLNPKFNYLAYDVADIDWQLGSTQDFMKLLDALYGRGINLIPDLPLAHQVKAPFEGALDQSHLAFSDPDAFQFRDYGTWMFNMKDALVRRQLVEKVVGFVRCYQFKTLRLGYLDGLILQYSQREINYGEIFLQELKAALDSQAPGTQLLGECFEARERSSVAESIDWFYAPYGFPIIEELYKPFHNDVSLDFSALVDAVMTALNCQRRNAIYAQLHDELSDNPEAQLIRHQTPWAYGKNPAELAKQQGESLIAAGKLHLNELLDYVRRRVRSAESLTMFCAKFIYLYVPAVDSLVLGCAETDENWKFHWDDVTVSQLEFWESTGLSDDQIYVFHRQHRLDMARLRKIFSDYTIVNSDSYASSTFTSSTLIEIYHQNAPKSVVALWRSNPERLAESLLVVFNLGSKKFKDNQSYQLPIPLESQLEWEVLFDGDYIDPLLRSPLQLSMLAEQAYSPGSVIKAKQNSITLNLGAYSLLILKVHLVSL